MFVFLVPTRSVGTIRSRPAPNIVKDRAAFYWQYF
jgi:hypothetical protein